MANESSVVARAYAYEQDIAALPSEIELGREECLHLSMGKMHGLQAVTNARGVASIIAMDQTSFFDASVRGGHEPTYEERAAVTGALVSELANSAERPSSLVVDPDIYGVLVTSDAVPPDVGLIVALERAGAPSAAGYLPGVTVNKVKRMGAAAAKLLVYMDTDNPELTRKQLGFVREAASAAHTEGILLIVEARTFPREGEIVWSDDFECRQRLNIIESAKLLREYADVLALEPVLGIQKVGEVMIDYAEWLNAAAGRRPWLVALSGVQSYSGSMVKLKRVLKAGAMGTIVSHEHFTGPT